jgi:prepilin-type N-terminal cleavage/methylation domain-containing protein
MIFARMTTRRITGHTLPELLVVLALLAIAASMTAPRVRSGLDVYAVRTARDATAAALAQARALALARGSAVAIVDGAKGTVVVEAPTGRPAGEAVHVNALFHVDIDTDDAPAATVTLRFDALGIGRFSNHTLRFRRGVAAAHLTLSSYGRPRRW